VVSALGLADNGYGLFGYSMGGRVALRMLVRGRAGRAVLAGQGFDVTCQPATGPLATTLLTAMVEGTPLGPEDQAMVDWMVERDVDPQALLLVLDSFVGTPPEALEGIIAPTLVVIGERDPRASAAELAAASHPPSSPACRAPTTLWAVPKCLPRSSSSWTHSARTSSTGHNPS